MIELPTDFADLLVELLEAGVRFLLVGGYAVAHHGHPRATKDMDIWVCPDEGNADRVIRALGRFGAPLASLGVTRDDFLTAGQTVQIGVAPLRIDLLTEIAGVEFDTAWAGRDRFQLGEHEVPILGRTHLLANKRAAGRPQDLIDVEVLERLGNRSSSKP
jgi:hypothetical protein